MGVSKSTPAPASPRAPAWAQAPAGAAVVAALLLAALLTPLAGAQSAPGRGGILDEVIRSDLLDDLLTPRQEEPLEERDARGEDKEGAKKRPAPAAPTERPSALAPLEGVRAGFAYAGMGAGGLLLVGAALVLGRLASRPARARLSAFESGRADALRRAPTDGDRALAALEASSLGRIEGASLESDGAWVAVKRRRGVTCAHLEGFLVGAFESAWGRDVRVEHVACGGRKRNEPCRFRVDAQ